MEGVWGQWLNGKAHMFEPNSRRSVCGSVIRPFRCGQNPVTSPKCAVCERIANKKAKEDS